MARVKTHDEDCDRGAWPRTRANGAAGARDADDQGNRHHASS